MAKRELYVYRWYTFQTQSLTCCKQRHHVDAITNLSEAVVRALLEILSLLAVALLRYPVFLKKQNVLQ